MDVLVVRPENGWTERTLSVWVDLLLPPGTGLPGVTVVDDLQGQAKATTAAIQAQCPQCDMLLYFGHGKVDALGDPVLLDTASIACASGRTVVAIACESADTLGPHAVTTHQVVAYLGFSEPLFVYNASPGLIGYDVAQRVGAFLTGTSTLSQVHADLTSDLQATEALYRTGANRRHRDAAMIWMGARMDWRGLELH